MPRARLRASGPLARLPLSLSNLGHPGISDKMGSISTRMTERFGCRHPFAGAGMAFAGSTADLALGVCAGGGIGAIGVGFTPAEQLRAVIHQIRAATDAPFNINFITCFDNDPQIRVCAEEKVPVASFHWGHPSPEHLRLLRDAGVSAWEQVGGVEAAKKAVGDGVEVIVAQGWEAGGHNYGGLPSMVLVPEILDAVSPALVLASGGIVDGRGVAAALALGADGVWVGTRLVATPEAAVHYEHKRRLVEGTGEQTVRSSIFAPEWPHFNPMRLLRNRVVHEWTDRLAEVPTVRDSLPVIGRTIFLGQETEMRKFNVLLPTADTDGDWEEMPWLAGQGVGLIHDIRPAKDVVETMMADAKAILKRLSVSL
jgi:NAD(P)H-dependent flavin oxidoreductase YrpB (nitropropane dioxygenase family)